MNASLDTTALPVNAPSVLKTVITAVHASQSASWQIRQVVIIPPLGMQ